MEELEAVEIKRKNILTEDNRRIKMAELAAFLNGDSRDSDDDLSSTSSYRQSRPVESNVDVLPSTTLATQKASGVLKNLFLIVNPVNKKGLTRLHKRLIA